MLSVPAAALTCLPRRIRSIPVPPGLPGKASAPVPGARLTGRLDAGPRCVRCGVEVGLDAGRCTEVSGDGDHRGGFWSSSVGDGRECGARWRSPIRSRRSLTEAHIATIGGGSLAMAMIDVPPISTETYRRGKVEIPVLKGISLRGGPWRDGRADGGVRVGQDDAGQPAGRSTGRARGCIGSTARTSLDAPGTRSVPCCGTGRSASSSRTSTCCPATPALENVMMPLAYAADGPSPLRVPRPGPPGLARAGRPGRPDLPRAGAASRGASSSGSPSQRAMNHCSLLLIADEPTGNLDSKTGEEILGLFPPQSTPRTALTIILVTHDLPWSPPTPWTGHPGCATA